MTFLENEPSGLARELSLKHKERREGWASKAVPDRPINLRFKNGIDPDMVRRIEIKDVESQQETNNANEIKDLREKIAGLQSQFEVIFHRLFTGDLPETGEPTPIRSASITEITKEVCVYFHASKNEIVSPRRDKATCYIRHIALYLAKRLTTKSYPEIGRMFGGRDHTTIMHSFRKVTAQRLVDAELDTQLKHLEGVIADLITREAQ